MSEEGEKRLTLRELSEIHRVSFGLLGQWQRQGVDVTSSCAVALRAIQSRTPPEEWKPVKDVLFKEDDDTHEYWKKAKTKEEVERLRLANSKAAGEMFERKDGEAIRLLWASALKLQLAELVGRLPEQIAGKDHAVVADILESEAHRIQEELSDLESAKWREVFDAYASEASANGGGGTGNEAASKANGQRVVRGKREPGAGTHAET